MATSLTPFAPLVFFAVLLGTRLHIPPQIFFDETHYVPASKALIQLLSNHNYEHPPLAKWLLGGSWMLFHQILHIMSEPAVFRFAASLFGLWTLWSVYAWMKELGFNEETSQMAMWLTGANFLWFVLSKTIMLESFFVAFASWGLLCVWRSKREEWTIHAFLGWALLGLSLSCKWSALPFFPLAVWILRKKPGRVLIGLIVSGVFYFIPFIPLAFLAQDAVAPNPVAWFHYHQSMWEALTQVHMGRQHPYQSGWWQWPLLIRPTWFVFDAEETGVRSVWAGGNPLLFWSAIPCTFFVLYRAFTKKDKVARWLAAFYWCTYLFWAVFSGQLTLFYYYFPASMWLVPIVLWTMRELKLKRSVVIGYTLLCMALFFYFLPIMDGRVLPPGGFFTYMWLKTWI